MIEQAVKAKVKNQFGKNDGAIFNSVLRQVKRGMIQQMTYINQVFTRSEIKDMGIES